MPTGFSPLSPVRKEVRGVILCAAAYIVDRVVRDARIVQLKSYQSS